MKRPTASEIIELYKMVPLEPEGGFFKETYKDKSTYSDLPAPFTGRRPYSTAIYYLLPKGAVSLLHRIASDEVWHFYLGGPMTIVQISPDGNLQSVVLGQNLLQGEVVQHVVPAGHWFGGFPNCETDFAFVGCTVAPGFDYTDFEMANRDELLRRYPQHKEMVETLTQTSVAKHSQGPGF